MLSVIKKPFVLSVIMLSVVMLNVIMLNVIMLNVATPIKGLCKLATFFGKNVSDSHRIVYLPWPP
jgi:hypothetical protein